MGLLWQKMLQYNQSSDFIVMRFENLVQNCLQTHFPSGRELVGSRQAARDQYFISLVLTIYFYYPSTFSRPKLLKLVEQEEKIDEIVRYSSCREACDSDRTFNHLFVLAPNYPSAKNSRHLRAPMSTTCIAFVESWQFFRSMVGCLSHALGALARQFVPSCILRFLSLINQSTSVPITHSTSC
ncbi:hypothetical protein M433DRAFT_444116 [Acidomyces richmondensis BFW]|nr:MAG: hypothetical protein FE78DRAFT_244500 [Acidomyces sp. 'richmondensis']KYG48192.1 hypothetical protein M433DRAFT_444116 [Acidomyces richmondensis BFW]